MELCLLSRLGLMGILKQLMKQQQRRMVMNNWLVQRQLRLLGLMKQQQCVMMERRGQHWLKCCLVLLTMS
jgi:hypothetical protein